MEVNVCRMKEKNDLIIADLLKAACCFRHFAEYIDSNVITAIVNNSPEDVLDRFTANLFVTAAATVKA